MGRARRGDLHWGLNPRTRSHAPQSAAFSYLIPARGSFPFATTCRNHKTKNGKRSFTTAHNDFPSPAVATCPFPPALDRKGVHLGGAADHDRNRGCAPRRRGDVSGERKGDVPEGHQHQSGQHNGPVFLRSHQPGDVSGHRFEGGKFPSTEPGQHGVLTPDLPGEPRSAGHDGLYTGVVGPDRRRPAERDPARRR